MIRRPPYLPDVADVAGPQPGQRQAVTFGGGDGAGVDRRLRMGSGRYRRDVAGPAPQRCGQVRAAELAVQTNSTRSAAPAVGGGQRVEGAGDQLKVGAAAVAFDRRRG